MLVGRVVQTVLMVRVVPAVLVAPTNQKLATNWQHAACACKMKNVVGADQVVCAWMELILVLTQQIQPRLHQSAKKIGIFRVSVMVKLVVFVVHVPHVSRITFADGAKVHKHARKVPRKSPCHRSALLPAG